MASLGFSGSVADSKSDEWSSERQRLAFHHPYLFPKIVFFGAHPRLHIMFDVYGLDTFKNIAICDKSSHLIDSDFRGRPISSIDMISLADVELLIITEDPIAECFAATEELLKSKGVPDHKILRISQPGSIHRAITKIVNIKIEHKRDICYRSIRQNLFHRGHYAYCMILAAETAIRMGLKKFTAVEFGVWRGIGLINLCEIADFINQTLGVEINLIGFDTGEGLPGVLDYRDHPELWASGTLVMPNYEKLRNSLPDFCKLVIGDIRETLHAAMESVSEDCPIGFVSIDVDQYHSTVSCLKLFDISHNKLLPVIAVWVDDSYLSVLQTSWAGEALAIREFNETHTLRKIEQKIVRTDDYPRLWHHCIWFAHIFDHDVRQGKRKANFDAFYHTNY